MLAFVIEKVVNKAQTRVMPGRTIYDNLHFMYYTMDRLLKEPDMGGTQNKLDKSKAFDRTAYMDDVTIIMSNRYTGPVGETKKKNTKHQRERKLTWKSPWTSS